ncbi:MAG: uroporphyrinogen-III synthase [Magnetovibrionaceae bacterium]
MRFLLTRPRADSEKVAEKLVTLGHRAMIEPLLSIHSEPGPPLDLEGAQGLLITSANGLRAFCNRNAQRDLVVWAVGEASASEARAVGFDDVHNANGDAEALARLVIRNADPKDGWLVHPAGTKVAGDLAGLLEKAGFDYRRRTIYRAETARLLSDPCRRTLIEGGLDGVLLYSPRTARTFAELVRQHGLERQLGNLTAYCLSAAVADRLADQPFGAKAIAERPEESCLFDLFG